MQISVKLFTNDAEEALKKIYLKPIDLINGKDKEGIQKILEDYIQKHLMIKPDGKILTFKIIGYEKEEEATWIYLEAKNCPEFNKIEIENTLLYDYLKSQINIVNFDENGIIKSSKVTNPEKNITFLFP